MKYKIKKISGDASFREFYKIEKGSTNDGHMSKGKSGNNDHYFKINHIDMSSSDKLELMESYQDFIGGSLEKNVGEMNDVCD